MLINLYAPTLGSPKFIKASQVVLVAKKLPANAGDIRYVGLIPGLGGMIWRRK